MIKHCKNSNCYVKDTPSECKKNILLNIHQFIISINLNYVYLVWCLVAAA